MVRCETYLRQAYLQACCGRRVVRDGPPVSPERESAFVFPDYLLRIGFGCLHFSNPHPGTTSRKKIARLLF